MIHHLDNLLRHLFMTQVDTITEEGQIGFQPPDEAWRTAANSVEKALNIYLFDLRENRKLRSSERVRSVTNGVASEEPAPARLDCHYLISAWSRVQAGEDDRLKPTLDEHTLLYAVTAVLMKNAPLNPARVYGENTAAEKTWGAFWEADLPSPGAAGRGLPKAGRVLGRHGREQPLEAGGLPSGDAAGGHGSRRSRADRDDTNDRVPGW